MRRAKKRRAVGKKSSVINAALISALFVVLSSSILTIIGRFGGRMDVDWPAALLYISITLVISLIVLNTLAAIPGVPRKPSPTTQMIARPFSTRTVPSRSSS